MVLGMAKEGFHTKTATSLMEYGEKINLFKDRQNVQQMEIFI